MKISRNIKILNISIFILLFSLFAACSSKTLEHTDHSTFFQEEFIDGPSVTKACLECHKDASHEVMKTAHWNWQGEEVIVPGHDQPVRSGKKNVINNFCIGVESNWPSCTKCHIGYGWEDESFDFGNQELVDCLVCHDNSGLYEKKGKGAGLPGDEVDLLVSARSVGRPTRNNCGQCHFQGGGGNAVKHGDLDNTLLFPHEGIDIHMGREGFECIDCHQTKEHLISGRSISVSVDKNNRTSCVDCHDQKPHNNLRLDLHTNRVACQTCHIPEFGVEEPTKMTWDWSEAGQDLDITDKHEYMKIKGRFTYENKVIPEYYWYNLKSSRYLLGDIINPDESTKIAYPLGEINDKSSKIWPFKVHRGKQIYDKNNKYFLVPNVAGKDAYWKKFDWDVAARNGSKVTGLDYSGEFDFAPTEMYWPLSHMVTEKSKALQCNDCHGTNGRMNWEALGYEMDPLGKNMIEHDEFEILDINGDLIVDSENQISFTATCSECHELEEDEFIDAHKYHKNINLTEVSDIRLSLLHNGPILPSEETGDMNCFLCHTEVQPVFDENTIDDEGIYYPVFIKPTQNQCGNCHGVVETSKNGIFYFPNAEHSSKTELTGEVYSYQRISDSDMNITNRDNINRSWDIHAERMVECTDCHYNTDNLNRMSDMGKPEIEAVDGEMRQCESCHTTQGNHDWLEERNKHFSTLNCEACHINTMYAPAKQFEDKTVIMENGEYLVGYRGLNNGLWQNSNNLITGFNPFMMKSDNDKLSPFNLITTWKWVDDSNTEIDKSILQNIFLIDGHYTNKIIKSFDTDNDGELSSIEIRLDLDNKVNLIANLLTNSGINNPHIVSTIDSYQIYHGVSNGKWSNNNCESCHLENGTQRFELSPYLPGGVQPILQGEFKFVTKDNKLIITSPTY